MNSQQAVCQAMQNRTNIPAGIIVLLMHIFSNYNGVIELFINIIGLVYLYFGGVILSFKLYDWKVENIK